MNSITLKIKIISRIAINDFSVRPLVDDLGIDVQPATSTNFAIEAVSELWLLVKLLKLNCLR